jgi:hypothetical protein
MMQIPDECAAAVSRKEHGREPVGVDAIDADTQTPQAPSDADADMMM